jgi:diguanylate cyclase (GGDEF)-like protein
VRWIWARGFPVRDESGAIHRIAATAEDITERKEHQNKIARLSRIRAVLSGISSAMLRLRHRDELLQEACRVAATEGVFPMAWAAAPDPRTNTLEVVAAHGGDPAAIDFIRGSARDAVPVQDRPAYRVMRSRKALVVNDLALDPAVAPVREELLRRGFRSGAAFPLFVDGEIAAVLVLLAGERDFFDAEEIALLDWLASDLSFALDHIAKSERLNFLAYYDALTGLPNAALFVDRVGQYVHAAGQAGDRIAVILIDMLRFRAVNDEHGRQVGDIVLNMIAERLSAALPEACTLARIGADKFAVAKSGDADAAAALIHDTVLAVLGKPFQHDGKEIRLAAKAGIAVFPTDGLDAETLLTRAEAALEQAKSSTEPFQFYAREVNVRIAEKLALEEQLRSAVAGGQFVVHYQPRVDLTSGELVGAEALIRWQHPDRGLVAPGEFIGLAEATGLIVPIGSWVIDAVCAQQAAWSAAGIGIVPVAVNLSSVQFEKGDLLQTVRAALTKHALDPRQLDLELTESAVMGDPAAAAKTLQAVRKLGVGLALDDFGTGYSSLAHLKRFPFDLVKIDQSFIADITSNIEDAAIATAIIAMAHRLQLKVVAEGVETQGQCNYLRAQGCDQLQGHFFSPAVAAEAFELLLRSGKRMSLSAPDPADQRTLLVLDDEQGIRAALNRVLRRDGYKILSAASPSEAFDLLAINRVQVVVSDQRMPEMSGTAFLQTVAQLYPDTVRIILSGYTDLEVVTDSVNRGSVFKFLTKPWDDDLLRAQVRDAFRRYRPERA